MIYYEIKSATHTTLRSCILSVCGLLAYLLLVGTAHAAGSISVSSDVNTSWNISGPVMLSGSGTAQTYTKVPLGVYTIIWDAVPGYTTPQSSSKTLTDGGSIDFSAVYTPMTPGAPVVNGPLGGRPNDVLTFTLSATDQNGDQVRYGIDWTGDTVVDEWVPSSGYVSSGREQTVTHAWGIKKGTASFSVVTQDEGGLTSARTPWSVKITASNNPPSTVTIGGPTFGDQNQSLSFTLMATDPNGHVLRYAIDWDNNGTIDEYQPSSGYVASGDTYTLTKSWGTAGTKYFGVMAEDFTGSPNLPNAHSAQWARWAVGIDGDSGTNNPPAAPIITGPTQGAVNQSLTFKFISTDPEGDQVRYGIDWGGDTVVDEWVPSTGYVNSGIEQSITIQWPTQGARTLSVLAEAYGEPAPTLSCNVTCGTLCGPPPDPFTQTDCPAQADPTEVCYAGQTCEVQKDGQCGWTLTPEAEQCVASGGFFGQVVPEEPKMLASLLGTLIEYSKNLFSIRTAEAIVNDPALSSAWASHTVNIANGSFVDLTSTNLIVPGPFIVGQAVQLSADVTNSGSVSTPSTFVDQFTSGAPGNPDDVETILLSVITSLVEPVLGSNAARTDTASYTFTQAGMHQFCHVVDAQYSIEETSGGSPSEGNNTMCVDYSVESLGTCACTTNAQCSAGGTCSGGICVDGSQTPLLTCPLVALPIVSLPTSSNTTATTSVLGGTVDSNGNSTILERGTCWGTAPSPTTNCLAEGNTGGTRGSFSHTRSGLPPETTIYYRAYADNALGRGYSEDGTFTTLPGGPKPVVTTLDATNILDTGATFNGTAHSNGGGSTDILYRYGTTAGTCGSLPNTVSGGNIGSAYIETVVPVTVSSVLTPNTTYYYCVTATNPNGTTEGSVVQFTTAPLAGAGCSAAVLEGTCAVGAVAHGASSGLCANGFGGACSYTCTNGVWGAPQSNTCIPPSITKFEVCDPADGSRANCVQAGGNYIAATGTPLTLGWSAQADSCTAVMGAGFTTAPGNEIDGSDDITAPMSANTVEQYQIACRYGTGVPVTKSLTVTTYENVPVLTTDFTVVKQGDTVQLNWDTHNIDESTCTLTGGGVDGDAILGNGAGGIGTGYAEVTINGRTTFVITCGGISAAKTVEIFPTGWEG